MKRVIKSSMAPITGITESDKVKLKNEVDNICYECYENDELDYDVVMEHMEEIVLDPEYLEDREYSEGAIALARSKNKGFIKYVGTLVQEGIENYE